MSLRLAEEFFQRDVLDVAPELIGKTLVRKFSDGEIHRFCITEVEAYRGIEDLACHASKGLTARTEIMFDDGGKIYVYLIYGIYWMLNFVTGYKDDASAVLIRGINNIKGPGKVGKELQLDRSFYGENLSDSNRIWIEDTGVNLSFHTSKRVGIEYAGEPWVSKPWRYVALI